MESIKAPSGMEKGMEEGSLNGATDKHLKANGKMVKKMDTASGEVLKAIFTKVNGKITNKMGKVYTFMLEDRSILVILKIF